MRATITIHRHGQQVQCYRIDQPGQYLIGRDPACPIQVDLPGVAGQHARLTLSENVVEIEDLGSAGGTFLDSARLGRVAAAVREQTIQVGEATLVIRAEAESLTVAEPARLSAPVGNVEILRSSKYELGPAVARGGMGAIWQARDRDIRRSVAVKVVLDEKAAREDVRQRFLQEARLTGQLEHPNIVPVHELSVDERGQPFYTMKLVKGASLHEVLERIKAGDAATLAAYSLAHLLTIFQKVCDAIAFAHSKGVVHRDLKPANIMIGEYGEVLVMDWGLAKKLPNAECRMPNAEPASEDSALDIRHSALGLTLAGEIMGTPQFMAPEQAEGKVEEIDARTDIFALGAILYSILTLHPPVTGDSVHEVLEKMRRGEIVPPSSYNEKTGRKTSVLPAGAAIVPRPPLLPLPHCPSGRVPESLSAVCMKALALRRQDRYQTVPELQNDIEAHQGGFATIAEQAGAFKLIWLLFKRHKVEFLISHAALLVLLVGGIAFTVKVTGQKRRAERALAELRDTAPVYRNDALSLIRQLRLEEALQRISYATVLVPTDPDYHNLRGNICETLLRLKDARDEYTRVLRLKPDYPLATENLKLCEKIFRENAGRKDLLPDSLRELREALERQQRPDEARALLAAFTQHKELLYEACQAILKKCGGGTCDVDKEGHLQVDLSSTGIKDLAPLRGMPLAGLRLSGFVRDLTPLQGMPLTLLHSKGSTLTDLSPLRGARLSELSLETTGVSDLSPLVGMPLKTLNIADTTVSDLSPLAGMPLRDFKASNTRVSDLRPLAGMPLERLSFSDTPVSDLTPLKAVRSLSLLNFNRTRVTDLSPLQGKTFDFLYLNGTGVSDLSPLAGLEKLVNLDLGRTQVRDLSPLARVKGLACLSLRETTVGDLSPLKGQPLQILILEGCQHIQDLTPLADFPQLDRLIIPDQCKNVEVLRRLPNLKHVGYHKGSNGVDDLMTYWEEVPTVAEFWKAYDAKQADKR